MKNLGMYIVTDCVSFTILVVLNSVAEMLGFTLAVSAETMLQLFCVTTMIALLMWILDRFFPEEMTLAQGLVQMACVIACVFGLGGAVFKWFAFTWPDMLLVLGVAIGVYLAVLGVLLIRLRTETACINNAIRKKKSKVDLKDGENNE